MQLSFEVRTVGIHGEGWVCLKFYFEKFLGINFQFEVRTVGIRNDNWLDLKASHFLFIFVIFVKHGYLSTYLIVICLLAHIPTHARNNFST
jgi:hypothetical protein